MDIPIIGSLNGVSIGGWTNYAGLIEDAGADALELNIYYVPTSLEITGREVEDIYIDMLRQVKQTVTIPVAIKLSPFFSSVSNMAQRLVERGANGLVFFNRFYQPDFDLEALEVAPRLVLSNSHELRLPATLGGDSVWTNSRGSRDYHRRAYFRRCFEGPDGRGESDDDGFRAFAERPASHQGSAERGGNLDGRARIRLSRADDWQHEPATLRGTRRVRARELHESAGLLPARELIWSAATRRRFGRTLDLLPISILASVLTQSGDESPHSKFSQSRLLLLTRGAGAGFAQLITKRPNLGEMKR